MLATKKKTKKKQNKNRTMSTQHDNTTRFQRNYPPVARPNALQAQQQMEINSDEVEQPVKKALKDNVKNFMTTTSVKGISKAIKAESKVLRVVWIISTCTGLAVSITLIALILVAYFRYDVVTNIDDCSTCIPEFPDITVCPLNALPGLADLELTSYEEYSTLVWNTQNAFNVTSYPLSEYQHFLELYSTSAYYENVNHTQFWQAYGMMGSHNVFVHDCSW